MLDNDEIKFQGFPQFRIFFFANSRLSKIGFYFVVSGIDRFLPIYKIKIIFFFRIWFWPKLAIL